MEIRATTRITGGHKPPAAMLAAFEAEARTVANRVAQEAASGARTLYPAGRHNTRARIRGRVVRLSGGGFLMVVAPPPARAYIARFVEGGTGTRGPLRRPIPRGKRGRLPSGAVPSGRGQAPQWPFERTRQAHGERAVRELSEAASTAARRVTG